MTMVCAELTLQSIFKASSLFTTYLIAIEEIKKANDIFNRSFIHRQAPQTKYTK